MKSLVGVLLLSVVSIGGWAQDRSTETKSSAVGQKSAQEIKLKKAVMYRFKEIESYLPSETKRKANLVVEEFGKRLASSSESDDLYQLAKGEIIKQFTTLTQKQLDLMVIYTFVKITQAKNSAADGVVPQLFTLLNRIVHEYRESQKNVIRNMRG